MRSLTAPAGVRAIDMPAPDPFERWHELGGFIREQRRNARLSLRKLSEQAGISNPYLSQIERGRRKPSAEILQAIARGLRISAETLYVQAGILEEHPAADVEGSVMADPALTERHKQTLIDIYRAFREDRAAVEPALLVPAEVPERPTRRRKEV